MPSSLSLLPVHMHSAGNPRTYARMPAELWDEVTLLTQELGATLVERTLELNRAALLRRMEEYEQNHHTEEVAAFVELPRTSSGVATGSVIEMEDATGLRMTLRLPPGDVLDLELVVRAFRGAR